MTVKLEFQHFHCCPNGHLLLERVREAIAKVSVDVELIEMIVEDNETAARVKFLGSPTLLINGHDLMGVSLPDDHHFACRYYAEGLPSIEFIIQRIKDATFSTDR